MFLTKPYRQIPIDAASRGTSEKCVPQGEVNALRNWKESHQWFEDANGACGAKGGVNASAKGG